MVVTAQRFSEGPGRQLRGSLQISEKSLWEVSGVAGHRDRNAVVEHVPPEPRGLAAGVKESRCLLPLAL